MTTRRAESLQDFIPEVSTDLESPRHLEPITSAVDRVVAGETVREAFSVPPRHWKSTTLLHGVAWLFTQRPGFRVGYFTYGHDFAATQSREAMRIASRAGLRFDRRTFADWTTTNGCSFRATSLIAGATGEGFDLVIIDDPYRKRADAESETTRRRVQETFEADVFTRQRNTPASFLVVHTRWHTSDLIANITDAAFQDGRPFGYTNLPAINERGEALCPKYWPVDRLRPFMVNAYEWASQFMGQPVPRGGKVFGPARYCDDVPGWGRDAIGVDLAYTAKTKADYSVWLCLREFNHRRYLVDVVKRQVRAPEFARELETPAVLYPGAPMRWYAYGPEKGSADHIVDKGIGLEVQSISGDKFVRAQGAADWWNDEDRGIWIPRGASWAADAVRVIGSFTGLNDAEDDIVDALSAASDLLDEGVGGKVQTIGASPVFGDGRGVFGSDRVF